MSTIYHSFIYTPLYNLLVLLFKIAPWADAGVIVVLLTLIVRFVLFPLSKKAIVTQVAMQEINPKLAEIKEKHKDSQEEQTKATLALYKEKGINPFSGILLLIVQLPIIWALYRIFLYGGLPTVNLGLLYSFVHAPSHINTVFLGLIDITKKSAFLAALAAITSFFQLKIATGRMAAPQGTGFSDNLARSMQTQMKYFFPLIVFFISYKISGVIALYWLTTNLFTIAQELYVRRNLRKAASI
ncbi:MAG: 60 kDa inner rane insertion protein preprotein translocase subunit YidC [Parcubacteria group bacterium]|nr:60 kDa inner rane insertion protein preprotein translocase subunit YidC [Parcubacteria group bacterium]